MAVDIDSDGVLKKDSAMTALYVVVAAAVLVALWAIAAFNSLVRARNRVEESWSGVDVQLKRRHDLVPNLVESVGGYAQHERSTLEPVTRARAEATSVTGRTDRERAEGALSGALDQVRAVAERYPDLKASQNFQQLQRQLSEVENEIQGARRIYNSNVQFLNTKIQSFPSSLIARAASFRERDFFEVASSGERQPREVSLA